MRTPATRASGKALMTGVLFIAALTGCCVSYAAPQGVHKPLSATFRPVALSEPTSDPTASPAPSPVIGESVRPIGPLPTPRVVPERKAKPAGAIGDAIIGGRASWYDWRTGEAAAGPALRDLLGKDWRGSRVRVCSGSRCVLVRLTDWCQCYRGTDRERLIDLDDRAFAALAQLSRGVIRVEIALP